MLIQLNIKNFALIEELTVDFNQGFNILSGETGAGKSILIDAIDYVLGGKFSKDLIRTGEDRTYVEALFSIEDNSLKEMLKDLNIEFDEDLLIISRETLLSGKSIIKVISRSLIVTQLKRIREKILDIHGQHQNQSLLHRSSHIEYLDNYIGKALEKPLEEFTSLRIQLNEVKEKISKLNGNNDREKLLDYIKFQLEDIEKGKLKIGEEEELKEEFNVLSNAEKINKALGTSYSLLNAMGDSGSVLDSLSKVISELSSIEGHLDRIKDKKEMIEGAFYTIEEASRDIRDLTEEIVYDEETLEKINERIYIINNYKKKYGKTVEDVLAHYEKLKEQYNEIVNAEEIIKELKNKEIELLEKMKKISTEIHNIRKENSPILEEKILKELSYVGLDKSQMEIAINFQDNYNERGFDDVCFMISTNPGEPLKPLERVLSGGELSRIMLALKCVFADRDEIGTLIFDEIDTGISGAVGQRVGEKMYQVSLNHQVLCITHLPQIAILSDHHYFVSKAVRDGKTYTSIKRLNDEEKIRQVASMMGGSEITEATLKNVREMLDFANKKKKEIKKN